MSLDFDVYSLGLRDDRLKDRYYENGWWSSYTVEQRLQDMVRKSPDKVLIYQDDLAITYTDFDELTAGLASSFINRLGIVPGDVIGIHLANGWEYIVARFAASRAGAIPLGLLPALGRSELAALTTKTQMRAVITSGDSERSRHLEAVMAVTHELTHPVSIVALEPGEYANVETFEALCKPDAILPRSVFEERSRKSDEVDILISTSGTTGQPKLIAHTVNTWMNASGVEVIERSGVTDADVFLPLAPFPGGTGGLFAMNVPLMALGSWACIPHWSARLALDCIERHQVTVVVGVPAQIGALLAQENGPARLAESGVRMFLNAGAPLPQSTAEELVSHGITPITFYGTSESSIASSTRFDDPPERLTTTVGRVSTKTDLRLLSPETTPVAPGEPGEVWLQSPFQSIGYYADPDATRASFGHLGGEMTGDIGVLDDEGYLRIVGRSKEMIVRGGQNIAPAEIEGLLASHPAVALAAVVGYPDDKLGERACAFVALRDGHELDDSELRRHFDALSVATYKHPDRLVVLEEMPQGPGGKVDKGALRRRALR